MKVTTLKTEYLKGSSGEPIDIRSMTNELPYFTVTQGAASDGRSVYIIFERKQREGRTHRCKIVKMDISSMLITKVSHELMIGHGNDLTYRDGILYITHSAGTIRYPKKLIIHRVDAKTLKKLSDIKVTIPSNTINTRINAFNGIAKFGDGFILRVMGSPVMLITDACFHAIRYFRTEKFYRTSQGIEQKDLVTYRIYACGQSSRRNFLVTFDDKGNLIERRLIEVTGEIEGIFSCDGKLYATIYRKTFDADGILQFSAYIVKLCL